MTVPRGHYECRRPECDKSPHFVMMGDKLHNAALDRKAASGAKGRVNPKKLARQAGKARR